MAISMHVVLAEGPLPHFVVFVVGRQVHVHLADGTLPRLASPRALDVPTISIAQTHAADRSLWGEFHNRLTSTVRKRRFLEYCV